MDDGDNYDDVSVTVIHKNNFMTVVVIKGKQLLIMILSPSDQRYFLSMENTEGRQSYLKKN